MGAYCDVCGNFDEEFRKEMEYPKDSDHCIQDYQPDCYYYWDAPLEGITTGGIISRTLNVCAKSVLI